jgi:hypothetical protein
MITPLQLQTVLNYAALAQAPVGQVMNDGPAIAAVIAFGRALQAGKVRIIEVAPQVPRPPKSPTPPAPK